MFHLTSLVACHSCGKCKPMIPLCKERKGFQETVVISLGPRPSPCSCEVSVVLIQTSSRAHPRAMLETAAEAPSPHPDEHDFLTRMTSRLPKRTNKVPKS